MATGLVGWSSLTLVLLVFVVGCVAGCIVEDCTVGCVVAGCCVLRDLDDVDVGSDEFVPDPADNLGFGIFDGNLEAGTGNLDGCDVTFCFDGSIVIVRYEREKRRRKKIYFRNCTFPLIRILF